MTDPRAFYQYKPGAGPSTPVYGFYQNRGYVDFVPTLGASALVAAATVSTGVTTFTLTGSSAVGTYETTIIAPETGQATGTLLAIDSTAATVSFGQSDTITVWNPAAGTGRAISITTSSSGDGGTYSIYGRDMYGYKMTETISVSQGTTNSSGYSITGQKAFKYISAITNTSTPTSTSVSIGLSNTFGFPMKTTYAGSDLDIRILASAFSSAVPVALSSANMINASTAATATSTTADVRGTYASTTAPNGTVRLQISVNPTVAAISAMSVSDMSPLFGVAQYSSI